MKSLFISALFILGISTMAFSQTYFVIHAKGIITNKTTGKNIKAGDKLSPTDELKFGSGDAVAVVMSREKGRMTLNGKKVVKNENGELMAFVNTVLFPMNSNLQMSTRAFGDKKEITNFKDFFESDDKKFVIVGNELTFDVGSKYPMSKKQRFVYRYNALGRTIQKKIKYEGKSLKLRKHVLYKSKGEYIKAESVDTVDFYYYDEEKKISTKLATFSPVYLDEKELTVELNSLIKFLKGNNVMKGEELEVEIYKYIYDVYGKTDSQSLHRWLENNTELNTH